MSAAPAVELPMVGVRMASAILTVYDPERYTVLDWRTWSTLKELDLLQPLGLSAHDTASVTHLNKPATCGAYLHACVRLAADADVSLRQLDRCLWVVSEKKLSAWAREGVAFDPLVHRGESEP